jgi:hypothetical protein
MADKTAIARNAAGPMGGSLWRPLITDQNPPKVPIRNAQKTAAEKKENHEIKKMCAIR